MKLLLLALLLSLFAVPALAQTPANFTDGQHVNAAQWNALFATKQDYAGPASAVVSCTGDITTALQNAVNVVELVGGGRIQLSAGACTVSGAVTINTSGGVYIVGQGLGATRLTLTGTFDAFKFDGTAGCGTTCYQGGGVSNLSFDGTGHTGYFATGVQYGKLTFSNILGTAVSSFVSDSSANVLTLENDGLNGVRGTECVGLYGPAGAPTMAVTTIENVTCGGAIGSTYVAFHANGDVSTVGFFHFAGSANTGMGKFMLVENTNSGASDPRFFFGSDILGENTSDPTAGIDWENIHYVYLQGLYSSTNVGSGLKCATACYDVHLSDAKIFNNGAANIVYTGTGGGTNSGLTITNSDLSAGGRLAAGTLPNVDIGGTAPVQISNSYLGAVSAAYGVTLEVGSTASLTGNSYKGVVTGEINDLTGGNYTTTGGVAKGGGEMQTVTGGMTISTGNIVSPAAPTTFGAPSWNYNVNNITGTMTGNNQFSAYYWGIIDTLNTDSNVGANINSLFFTQYNLGINHTGNRQLRYDFLNVTGIAGPTDASGRIYVDHQMTAQGAANVGGTASNNALAKGSLWSFDANSILTAAGTFWKEVYGAEIDVGLVTGSGSVKRAGSEVVLNANAAVQGTIVDLAYGVGAKTGETSPWENGFAFGNELAGAWPFDSTSCLICALPRYLPTTITSYPADKGLDMREVTFTTGAILMPNAGIDQNGNTYGGNLFTGSAITAENGSVASIAPVAKYGLTGGAYFGLTVMPTCTIEAPPNSGTPATCSNTHLQLNVADLITGTDVGCTNGDVLTASTSGTGTQATMTLTVVATKVTAVAITTPGDLTTAPGASPTTTGGTCSVQPVIHQGYGIKTSAVGTAGTLYPLFPLPNILVSGTSNTENTPALLVPTMSIAVATLAVNSPINFTLAEQLGGVKFADGSSTPTCSAAGGSPTCAINAHAGSFTFKATLGAAGSATTFTITPGFTAATGWVCTANDNTTSTERLFQNTALSATSATLTFFNAAGTATPPGATDVISGMCVAM